jgi:hypothetical protein
MPYYHQLTVVTVLLCFGLVACISTPSIPSSDSVSLAVHESGQLPHGTTVCIDSIQDSRCPANAMCIWAGRVEVKVLLSKSTYSHSISLILQPGQQLDSTQITLGTVTYKVMLRSVLPYPGTDSTQTSKVTVQVTPM